MVALSDGGADAPAGAPGIGETCVTHGHRLEPPVPRVPSVAADPAGIGQQPGDDGGRGFLTAGLLRLLVPGPVGYSGFVLRVLHALQPAPASGRGNSPGPVMSGTVGEISLTLHARAVT